MNQASGNLTLHNISQDAKQLFAETLHLLHKIPSFNNYQKLVNSSTDIVISEKLAIEILILMLAAVITIAIFKILKDLNTDIHKSQEKDDMSTKKFDHIYENLKPQISSQSLASVTDTTTHFSDNNSLRFLPERNLHTNYLKTINSPPRNLFTPSFHHSCNTKSTTLDNTTITSLDDRVVFTDYPEHVLTCSPKNFAPSCLFPKTCSSISDGNKSISHSANNIGLDRLGSDITPVYSLDSEAVKSRDL